MCLDAMAREGRKQREVRTNWWRRKRSVNTGVVKTAFRKDVGKSPRKIRRRCHSPVCGKQKQAHAFPSGAMAPRNTTQYLMELVYSELNATEPSSRRNNHSPSRHEHTYSYEDTMDFQHRDFERGLSLGSPCLTAIRACAAGGSWLCVMCRCPECKLRPRLLRHMSAQVNLLHKGLLLHCSTADDFQLNFLSSGGQKDISPKGSQSSDL
ncbi:hypothetical protein QTP86_026779, partial [Hemibagrus guttatus]